MFKWYVIQTQKKMYSLASGLVNLYDEDLGSNMESDTEVNGSEFLT